MRVQTKIFFVTLSQCIIFLFYSSAFSQEGLVVDHFRFLPRLSVSEIFTDNIYLSSTDRRSDSITTISPGLTLDYALAPKNFITLWYDGQFRFYEKSDNFKKDIHRTGISWSWTTSKDTVFKVGGRAYYDSLQPYHVEDTKKDYVEREGYGETTFPLGAFTDVGIRYNHITQQFNDPLYARDEFDRDTVTLGVTYKRFPATSLLLEYTYYHQDNNDLTGSSTDMDTQIVLIGTKWEPTAKLSGFLKAGYYQTDVADGNDSNGFALDTDLIYRVSDSTQLKLGAFRRLVRSSRAARESGDYYISTGGNVSVDYRRWDPFTMSLHASYMNNKFKQQEVTDQNDRKDDLITAGITAGYNFRSWLSLEISYQYRMNDSNVQLVKYRENRVAFQLSFAL